MSVCMYGGFLWCVAESLHEWSEAMQGSAGKPRGRKRSAACGSDQLQVENSLRKERNFEKRVQSFIKDPDDVTAVRAVFRIDICC